MPSTRSWRSKDAAQVSDTFLSASFLSLRLGRLVGLFAVLAMLSNHPVCLAIEGLPDATQTQTKEASPTPRPSKGSDGQTVGSAQGFLAETANEKPPFEESSVDAGRVFLNLMLVLAILGGGLWLLKKYLPGQLGDLRRSRHMRVVDSMSLGMNRSLLLVHVGGEVHLIANTEKGLQALGRLENLGEIQAEIADDFQETLGREMGLQDTLGRLKGRLRKMGEGGA